VKAHNLKEAYNVFDPVPLEETSEPFYSQRRESLVLPSFTGNTRNNFLEEIDA
jgi:hypothetical protein